MTWDPMPRPPRRTASWLALLPLVAGGAYAYHAGRGLADARYPALAADVCPAVDVQPVLAVLKGPIEPPTSADPALGDRSGEGTDHRCRFSVTRADGVTPRAEGVVTITHYPYAPVAQVYHAVHRDNAGGSIYEKGDVHDLAGVGEEAFTLQQSGDFPSYRIGARDSNLLIDVELVVSPDEPEMPADVAFRTLSEALSSSLRRLR
ncbi:hypothetical protein [Actinoplanes sp. NPDC049316]|uniref:hypothetical protein n=1 Tax=Actinoplanes sp. NPDC049316 TaxID=3154727 RepID=UPI0034327CE4